jgi:hypothetical protein
VSSASAKFTHAINSAAHSRAHNTMAELFSEPRFSLSPQSKSAVADFDPSSCAEVG